jgi:hypothetical protein
LEKGKKAARAMGPLNDHAMCCAVTVFIRQNNNVHNSWRSRSASLKLGKICYRTPLFFGVCQNILFNCEFAKTHCLIKNEKVVQNRSWDGHPKKMVKFFFFWAVQCVLANMTQNCNGTWQSHN